MLFYVSLTLLLSTSSCFVAVDLSGQVDLSQIPTPPTFVHEPNPANLYYVQDETHVDAYSDAFQLKKRVFRCRAVAHPHVQYSWTKDGLPFDLLNNHSDRTRTVPNEGTFTFSHLLAQDEGTYVCHAKNGNGTAVDKPINFINSFMHRFYTKRVVTLDIGMGEAHMHSCKHPVSVPPARVYWILKYEKPADAVDVYNYQFKSINESRISTDAKGKIYFHYESMIDTLRKNWFYTCASENTVLDDHKFGDQFRVNVLTSGQYPNTTTGRVPPAEMYVTPEQEAAVAIRGTEHRLDCFFSGFPVPTPKWYKDGKQVIARQGEYKMLHFGKSLIINNVTSQSTGKYECRFPDNRNLDRTFNVRVEGSPYFPTGPPFSQNSTEGETKVFQCGAVGSPPPKYTFYKNGKELTLSGHYQIQGNKLTIRNLVKGHPASNEEGDNAVYQCKAENKHGFVWANFYLNILRVPPILQDHVPNVRAVAGSDVSLTCKFFGSPKPMVSWHSGPSVHQGNRQSKAVDGNGLSVMQLKEVTANSAGTYNCVANNKEGQQSGKIVLEILAPTRLLAEPTDAVVMAGEPLRMPCKAAHDPALELNVRWFIDGAEISRAVLEAGNIRIHDDHTLEIREPKSENSGIYECVAKTELDETRQAADIVVKDVPSMPQLMDVYCPKDTRSAEVKIAHIELTTLPAPLTELFLQYQIDRNGEYRAWRTIEQSIRVPFKNVNIDGINKLRVVQATLKVRLDPWGNYSFRAIARNEVGDSAPAMLRQGNDQLCVTAAAAPEKNPSNVHAEGSAEDNLIVHWDPMPREEWNGPGFQYVVRWRPEGEDTWQEADVTDPYKSMYTIPVDSSSSNPSGSDKNRYGNGKDKGTGRDDADGDDDGAGTGSAGRGRGGDGDGQDADGDGDDGAGTGGRDGSGRDGDGAGGQDSSGRDGAGASYQPYEVQVQSQNHKGFSLVAPQTVDGHSGEGVPMAKVDGFALESEPADGSSASFKWNPIDKVMMNGDFKGYKIIHWHDADSNAAGDVRRVRRAADVREEVVFDKDATRGTVHNLKPNKKNHAHIVVFNGAHDGPPSEELSFDMQYSTHRARSCAECARSGRQ